MAMDCSLVCSLKVASRINDRTVSYSCRFLEVWRAIMPFYTHEAGQWD